MSSNSNNNEFDLDDPEFVAEQAWIYQQIISTSTSTSTASTVASTATETTETETTPAATATATATTMLATAAAGTGTPADLMNQSMANISLAPTTKQTAAKTPGRKKSTTTGTGTKKKPRKSRSSSRQSTPATKKKGPRSTSTPSKLKPLKNSEATKASDLTVEELLGLPTAAADAFGRQDIIDQLTSYRQNVLNTSTLRSGDPLYIQISQKISYLNTYLPHNAAAVQYGAGEAPAGNYYGKWSKDKDKIRNLMFLPEPFSEYDFATYGGEIIQVLTNVPTEEDARAVLGDKEFKFSKGGIVKCRHYYPKDLKNNSELKNKIIHVIGKGFCNRKDEDPDFSYNDAYITHNLLYKHDNTSHAIVVELVTDEMGPHGMMKMRHLVGAVILTDDIQVHKKEVRQGHPDKIQQVYQKKNFRVFNLVQITILKEYSYQRLGSVAMEAVERALTSLVNPADTSVPPADFLFWAGCAENFYKRLGYSTDPGPDEAIDAWGKMFECPLKLSKRENGQVQDMTEEENREIFFYKSFTYTNRNKFRDLQDWYRDDPTHRYLTITYRGGVLKEYYNYGLSRGNGTGTKAIKRQEYIEEYPIVHDRTVDGVTTIDVEIQKYATVDSRLDCRCEFVKNFLFLYGRRTEGGREYGFDLNIKMAAEVKAEHIIHHGYTPNGLTISIYGEIVKGSNTAALI